MPLPSILIAPFYAWFGASYRVAQIPFVVLSCLLPLFTFYLTRRFFARDGYAWAAALFTAFSGFYTIYWVSPDNFTPFALTASLCLFFTARGLTSAHARDFHLSPCSSTNQPATCVTVYCLLSTVYSVTCC
jgi:4-amino-4-deoxy-L-arabinose transferase-like glycosyltransferase